MFKNCHSSPPPPLRLLLPPCLYYTCICTCTGHLVDLRSALLDSAYNSRYSFWLFNCFCTVVLMMIRRTWWQHLNFSPQLNAPRFNYPRRFSFAALTLLPPNKISFPLSLLLSVSDGVSLSYPCMVLSGRRALTAHWEGKAAGSLLHTKYQAPYSNLKVAGCGEIYLNWFSLLRVLHWLTDLLRVLLI